MYVLSLKDKNDIQNQGQLRTNKIERWISFVKQCWKMQYSNNLRQLDKLIHIWFSPVTKVSVYILLYVWSTRYFKTVYLLHYNSHNPI